MSSKSLFLVFMILAIEFNNFKIIECSVISGKSISDLYIVTMTSTALSFSFIWAKTNAITKSALLRVSCRN